ncbi:MAG: hypothetical protein Q9222_002220 [Ikaeria aurantiellina]
MAQQLELEPDTIKQLTRNIQAKLHQGQGAKVINQKQAVKAQGKKRLSDGRIKDSSTLEQDVLALGGTKDDVRLVQNEPSDSEMEGGSTTTKQPPPKELKKDLRRFIQELGIDKVAPPTNEEPDGDSEKDVPITPVADENSSESLKKSMDKSQKLARGNTDSRYQVEPHPDWHATAMSPLAAMSAHAVALPVESVNRLHSYAKSLLENENEIFASQPGSVDSARQFHTTIMSSGTLSDKISALTLSIQESPLHNMKNMETLVNLGRKRNRRQAVEVLGALKDLFGTGSVLPADRKLRNFADQPSFLIATKSKGHWASGDPLPNALTKKHLVLWAYEDWLKRIYFDILQILETWCNDEVVFARGKAVDYVCQLLKEKPEQEANLLRLLVNKLGDSDKKTASKTSYNILQLETVHPLMKPIIISSIESDLLFRPGQTLRAQYYAVITLNQTVLSSKEEDLAKKLLDMYFSLFAILLAKPKATTTAPSDADTIKINSKGDVQRGGGSAGKAARRKSALKEKSTALETDLREKMLSAVLTGVNRAVPYTNTNDQAIEKHLDTLFRVTHSSNFNTSIQALMLIQQITTIHQGSIDRFYRTLYESLIDQRLLSSSKQALYLNLLFKSLQSDLNVNRVKAFVKRLCQVASMHQPSFACAAIYMVRELESQFPNLSTFINDREAEDSEEEEAFHDVQENGIPWHIPTTSQKRDLHKYDPRKRDPEHSYAERSSLWELLPLQVHYHPSVSLFAHRLLTNAPMPPKPDLSSHTLAHFLDRFIHRNPKSTVQSKGSSIMQPLSAMDAGQGSTFLFPSGKHNFRDTVNSQAFRNLDVEKVGADEVFFHKYFSIIDKGKGKANRKKEKKRKRAEDEGSEDKQEEEIWKAMVESRPEIEGASDDEDLGMDDLEGSEDGDDERFDSGAEVEDLSDGAVDAEDDDDDIPAFDEHDEEMLESDDEVPQGALDETFTKENQDLDFKKREGRQRDGTKAKRIKLKHLPLFADVEEYADVLGADGDEDGRGS